MLIPNNARVLLHSTIQIERSTKSALQVFLLTRCFFHDRNARGGSITVAKLS